MDQRNVNISPEYLAKIRRFTAIRPEELFRYTPKVFREIPDDLRPVFILRPISGEDTLKLSDKMSGEIEFEKDSGSSRVTMHKGEFIASVCRRGIVGWENFYDAKGNIVPYANSIDILPRRLLEELADAVLDFAQLSEEEILGLK